jgi:hypothetical protein
LSRLSSSVCWYLKAKTAPIAAAINGIAIFSKTSVNVICKMFKNKCQTKSDVINNGLVYATI